MRGGVQKKTGLSAIIKLKEGVLGIYFPGQTFALVLVTASTRISFFVFLVIPLRYRFFTPKTSKRERSGKTFFKKRSDLFSFRFVPVLTYLRAPEFSGRSVAAAM
jgi:hypothetical protein